MKIGDIVKLTVNPSVDWMHNYLDKTFEVLDFLPQTGVKLKMRQQEAEWIWIIGKENLKIATTEDLRGYMEAIR